MFSEGCRRGKPLSKREKAFASPCWPLREQSKLGWKIDCQLLSIYLKKKKRKKRKRRHVCDLKNTSQSSKGLYREKQVPRPPRSPQLLRGRYPSASFQRYPTHHTGASVPHCLVPCFYSLNISWRLFHISKTLFSFQRLCPTTLRSN